MYLSGVNSLNLGFIHAYIYHGEVNIYQEQLDSFLESAQKLEIEGLLSGNEDSNETFNEGKYFPQEQVENIEHENYDHHAQDEEKSLARIYGLNTARKTYSNAQKDVVKIDVGSMTNEEIRLGVDKVKPKGWFKFFLTDK